MPFSIVFVDVCVCVAVCICMYLYVFEWTMSLSNKVYNNHNNNNNSKSHSPMPLYRDVGRLAGETLVLSLPQTKSKALEPYEGEVSYPGYAVRQPERLLVR